MAGVPFVVPEGRLTDHRRRWKVAETAKLRLCWPTCVRVAARPIDGGVTDGGSGTYHV